MVNSSDLPPSPMDFNEGRFKRLNVKDILTEAIDNATNELISKAEEYYQNGLDQISLKFLPEERKGAIDLFRKSISDRFRDGNELFNEALANCTNDEMFTSSECLVIFFISHIDSLSSHYLKLQFVDSFEEEFEEFVVIRQVFFNLNNENKEEKKVKKKASSKGEKKEFSNLIKDSFKGFLPELKKAYLGSKKKEKVIMLFAMKELDFFKMDFVVYQHKTEFHNLLVDFFGDSEEVGVRQGFWGMIYQLRDSRDERYISERAYHIEKITSVMKPVKPQ